jgi:hypothetical protein
MTGIIFCQSSRFMTEFPFSSEFSEVLWSLHKVTEELSWIKGASHGFCDKLKFFLSLSLPDLIANPFLMHRVQEFISFSIIFAKWRADRYHYFWYNIICFTNRHLSFELDTLVWWQLSQNVNHSVAIHPLPKNSVLLLRVYSQALYFFALVLRY